MKLRFALILHQFGLHLKQKRRVHHKKRNGKIGMMLIRQCMVCKKFK